MDKKETKRGKKGDNEVQTDLSHIRLTVDEYEDIEVIKKTLKYWEQTSIIGRIL